MKNCFYFAVILLVLPVIQVQSSDCPIYDALKDSAFDAKVVKCEEREEEELLDINPDDKNAVLQFAIKMKKCAFGKIASEDASMSELYEAMKGQATDPEGFDKYYKDCFAQGNDRDKAAQCMTEAYEANCDI